MTENEIILELMWLENKYRDLVWYARSLSRNDHIKGVKESREEVEINYPEETNSLLNGDYPDWDHGFNSGMLAGIRYYLDLNIYGKKEAEESFPCMDT